MKALGLLIGNANYPAGNHLFNAANDARDFGRSLHKLGFEIRTAVDVSIAEMDTAVDTFGSDLDNYDIGLFFYAGHGFQENGQNYLSAIDTSFNVASAVRTSLELRRVITLMERANNMTNILILDACREELFDILRYRGGPTAISLAPVYAPKGTIIAFSTSPGEKARDGTAADGNGIYTRALLSHVETQNLPIEEFFKRVRNSVYAFSSGQQTSWEHTSLTGNFMFNSGLITHATPDLYGENAIADKNFDSSDLEGISSIIESLKSHDWNFQNPAIKRIMNINPANEDKNKLFILGRNILQAAEGGSFEAQRFMERLSDRLSRLSNGVNNPVLDGMLFEVYFNSEGQLRDDKKASYLDNLWLLKKDERFSKSFDFINEQLKPYADKVFLMPNDSTQNKSIDVVLDEQLLKFPWMEQGQETLSYLVKSIVFEGEEIMCDEQSGQVGGRWIHHEELTFARFKGKLSEQLGIPTRCLTVNTNFNVADQSSIRFLYGAKVKRPH